MTLKVSKYRDLNTAPRNGDIYPLGIPAGTYDDKTSYIRTRSVCPIVEHNEEYWYPAKEGVLKGSEPSASNPAWKKADNFEVMLVKVLFAQFAKLGEAIFHGRFMFSQQGVVNGAASSQYKNFSPDDPDNEASAQRFAPNLYLDFQTGAARLAKGKAKFYADGTVEITGTIHATGGEFKGKLTSTNFYHNLVTMKTSGSVDASADIVFTTGENLRITLPTGNSVKGKIIEIYGRGGSAVISNTLYTGSIGTAYTVYTGDLYRVYYDGERWYLLSRVFVNPNSFSATQLYTNYLQMKQSVLSNSKTLSDDYGMYIVRASNITITLPQSHGYGRMFKILVRNFSSITLKAFSYGSTIQEHMQKPDGNTATSMALSKYRMYEIIETCDETEWIVREY